MELFLDVFDTRIAIIKSFGKTWSWKLLTYIISHNFEPYHLYLPNLILMPWSLAVGCLLSTAPLYSHYEHSQLVGTWPRNLDGWSTSSTPDRFLKSLVLSGICVSLHSDIFYKHKRIVWNADVTQQRTVCGKCSSSSSLGISFIIP